MRPLTTGLLCATMLLAAAGATAEQPARSFGEPLPPGLTPQAVAPAPAPAPNWAGPQTPLTLPPDAPGTGYPPFPQVPRSGRTGEITQIEPGCFSVRSRCQAEVDWIVFALDDGRDQPLVYNQLTGAEIVNTDDLGYDLQIGPRVTMGYRTTDGPIFETSYFGVYNYKSFLDVRSLPGPLGLLAAPRHFGESTIDYTGANRMQLHLRGRVNSVEANLRYSQENFPNTTALVGVRYVRLEERFTMASFDVVDPSGATSGLSSYDLGAVNNLYGVQFGTTSEYCFNSRFTARGSAKLGVFDDEASQRQLVTDQDSRVVLRDTGAHRSRGVFMVDMSVGGVYSLRNNVNFVAGYNLIWFNTMARATDQLDFTLNAASGTGVQFLEGALLHGAHFGLEARW